MFRIDTISGLHGTLVELVTVTDTEALVLVKRDSTPSENFPYSTHRVYSGPEGELFAEAGHYDLSLAQAQKDLGERAGRAV